MKISPGRASETWHSRQLDHITARERYREKIERPSKMVQKTVGMMNCAGTKGSVGSTDFFP